MQNYFKSKLKFCKLFCKSLASPIPLLSNFFFPRFLSHIYLFFFSWNWRNSRNSYVGQGCTNLAFFPSAASPTPAHLLSTVAVFLPYGSKHAHGVCATTTAPPPAPSPSFLSRPSTLLGPLTLASLSPSWPPPLSSSLPPFSSSRAPPWPGHGATALNHLNPSRLVLEVP